jgi:membrane associated rhomboid family serine protease
MPRSTASTSSFPPFEGVSKRLILIVLGVFFADALMARVLPPAGYRFLFGHIALTPIDVLHGKIWQLVTSTFAPISIFGTVVAALTLWFITGLLESVRGSRWVYDLFFASAIGGALFASAISFTHIFGLSESATHAGPFAGIFGMLIAIAVLMGETEFYFMFFLRIKAKYLVAIYILIDLALVLKTDNAFGPLIDLAGGFCGYLFLRYSPRRGLAVAITERWYGLRNTFYRAKRRRAARKFEVYMSKQGRQVHFDKDGKYIDPDKDPASRNGKDDKRWMN